MEVTEEALHRTAIPLLARNAEDLTWLARYVERVENLARILDVMQVFGSGAGGDNQWRMVLRINADEERFLGLHRDVNALTVAGFYLLDRSNPTSIPAAISRARELARTLRAQISTEMWQQLNVFHNRILALNENDVAPGNLGRLCAVLKEGCQTHTGITEGTLYRDEGYHFYNIGRQVERADQTTRLLDIGFRSPLESDGARQAIGWTLLLRAAAGYHAYRRVHPAAFNAEEVVDFLLLAEAFPRSVALTLRQVHWHLVLLRDKYGLVSSSPAIASAEQLSEGLGWDVGRRAADLASLQASLQGKIAGLHEQIAKAFFPA
jgi:uncharacterized alpha-E superfamily protein